ncbi:putative acetate kinase [Mycena indigotica]|uniref:Probable acetate kinase n=1 Tax=Mycena indigotica TaxID=2126181 RepID=A0A8H6WH39_9AGAR|nr:putative acetate kinase [Mycena indigotica]KAF7312099.1 putative acetate kinase [Mycena indigotica]
MVYVLSANAGSSSLKISLYDTTQPPHLILTSSLSNITAPPAKFTFQRVDSAVQNEELSNVHDHASAFAHFLECLTKEAKIDSETVVAVCHRVVHGGDYTDPVLINDEAFHHIEKLSDLAPLHNGAALAVIKTCLTQLPHAKSIAFFDTAFHRSIPAYISSYAIDQKIAKQRGLKKYGFHGLSYSSILRAVSHFLQKPPTSLNMIVLHLGSGASVCCIRQGHSLDTSMGLTPLDGLPGATRSGAIDPSLIFHYTNKAGRISHNKDNAVHLHVTQAEQILNSQSGWKAIAGTTDFGDIIRRRTKDSAAQLAFDLLTDRILNFVGSYHLKLGGQVDALVFSGGIGERSQELRAFIGQKVECLGFTRVDQAKNENVDEKTEVVVDISASPGPKAVLVCRTDEQLEMAQHVTNLISMLGDKRLLSFMRLPTALVLLLNAALTSAQARTALAVGFVQPGHTPNPPFFTIPSATRLAISVAVCSGTTNSASPRFFVTNSSSTASPGSGGGENVFEIVLDHGHGSWTGVFPEGGVVGVEDAGDTRFEIGVSNGVPIHEVISTPPLFGDSTASQALLFSPPFSAPNQQDPTYPKYILPPGNLSAAIPPSNPINFTVIVSPTSNSLTSMQQTACMLKTQNSTGVVAKEGLWMRDSSGWRMEWLFTGLTAKTNYTVYAIESGYKVAGPIFFTTKSPSFSCPLVSQVPYCPSVGYATPLPPPPNPLVSYDGSSLPESISGPLISSLTNFTTSLTTFACGRDLYSPLVSCADCQRAYRTWLCTISFPRCADQDTSPSSAALLLSQPPNARNSAFPAGSNYTQLLPCLETCTATDRACPNFLGFRCPSPRFNAAESYGVGYVDSGADGVHGHGTPGMWSDNFGNVWCNSGQ